MATRDKILILLNNLPTEIDLTQDQLAMSSLELTAGGAAGTGTALTKAILDNLVTLQDGSDIAASLHHHDGRYYTETELGSATASSGSDLIGDDNNYSNFTPAAATVKGALSGIDSALATAGAGTAKVSANDTTADYLENKIVATNTTDNATSALEITTLNDAADEDLEINFDETKITITSSQISDAGSASGVATLDGSGKLPSAQLPTSAMEYKGAHNVSTNTPTLIDGTGTNGDMYRVSVGGTRDYGSGNITLVAGDALIYNGSIWEKIPGEDIIQSVNGLTGVVVLDTDDISEGTNLYYTEGRFDTSFSGKSTTDLSEGTNLYYTDERAQDAIGTILLDTPTIAWTYDDATPNISADVLYAPAVKKSMVAGEAFAANTSFIVRWALSGETAGRVYKADSASAAANGQFYAIGIALSTSAITAGQSMTVTRLGTHTLGSSDTNFGAGDVGKPVYLTDAGAFSVTAPADSGDALKPVGMVEDVDKIDVDIQELVAVLA